MELELTIATIPQEIAKRLKSGEDALYVSTYNGVFMQTQSETMATAAAMGAVNKARLLSVRSIQVAENGDLIVGGWAIKFSDGAADDRDWYDEYFSRASHLLLEYYQNAPLFYEHGLDADYGKDVIGVRARTAIYRFGVWMEHRVYAAHKYFERTKRELEALILGYSTGAINHLVTLHYATGENRSWPAAECSLTKSPAEVALGPVSVKSFVSALETAREQQQQQAAQQDNAPQPSTREASALEQGAASVRSGSNNNNNYGGGTPTMDPKMLAELAAYFGVDATPEAVGAALQQLLAQLQGGQVSADTMMSMRSALGLAADADVTNAFKGFLALVVPESGDDENDDGEEDDGEPAFDFGALKRAGEHAIAGARRGGIPYRTGGSGSNGNGAQPGRKNVNVNVGKARKPGIIDVINGISTKMGKALPMPAFAGKSVDAAFRAMNITEGPNGGYLLNREQSTEILEEFLPAFFLERLGVRRVDMAGIESLTLTKYLRGGAAYFIGEGQTVNQSNGKFARLTLQLRQLAAATTISNRLLAHATPKLEQTVRADLINATMQRAEKSVLYGTGGKSATSGDSGQEPLGLLNTPNVNDTELGSGDGAAPTLADIEDAEGRMEDNDVPEGASWGWLMAPRSLRVYRNMKDADGRYIFNREDATLLDYPAVKSNLIRKDFTVGASTDCSHIFLGAWEYAAYGLGQDIELTIDKSIRVQENETYIRMDTMFDFGVFFSEAFEILSGVR